MAKGEKKNKNNKKGISKNTKMLIAVIAAVVLLVGGLMAVLFLMPTCSDPNAQNPVEATYPTDANGREYAVDSKGNKIENDEGVQRDKYGKIYVDGVVEITNQGPLLVKQIDIENESGTYTILSETPVEKTTDADGKEIEQTQDTIYTLVGFEDAELQTGAASSVANQASNMETTAIIDIKGENLSDYGLDKPRAKVKTTFTDGTVVQMDIGNDAPDDLGTYIKYSDKKEVYLAEKDLVNTFMFSTLDFLSKDITDKTTTEEAATLKTLTLSGANFPEKVTMVPNDDETCAAYYKITAPDNCFANVVNGDSVKGSIRGLAATSVTAYHPSDDQLSKYGVSKPAATVEATYADGASYKLSASAPDNSGNVYIYNHDTKILYQIADTSVPWATIDYEDLKYEYVLKPIQDRLSSIEVTADGKTYKFGLEKVTKTDDDGNETTSTKITCGGKSIAESKFSTFFDNLTSVQRNGDASNVKPSGKAVLTVKYNYNNGKASDTVNYYSAENRKMLAQVNGKSDTYVFETYTSKIIEDAKKLAGGGTVTPI
ncbi:MULTISPECIES: DUF4340 domain-containing protein [unclassified Ruminococcus]|uniref:DUF4340 domain-containing protein n=1 Tax=unclassified Ruminococcus TaxID=2608920 RepID=UPI00210D5EA9|nr:MULTISPECIES: DUF4340 domain-containing protein [unclassified Ruminococcus]MCQ4021446.1 DUF4340 domain-containing protein [Ruminococcus sp. zg-924]MCQ4113891.1 DUF4340 domain-containing protein [Ruminococcus sp. zg-921]